MQRMLSAAVMAAALFAMVPTLQDTAQTMFGPRGSFITTGHVGQMQTTTTRSGLGQGTVISNGNGVGTLVGPNGTTTIVQTGPGQ
jgi:hypothetical protein